MANTTIDLQVIIEQIQKWETRIIYSEHYKKLGYKCMLSIVTEPVEQQEINRSRLVHTEEVRRIALRLWNEITECKLIRNAIARELRDKFKKVGVDFSKSRRNTEKENEFIRALISIIATAHDIGHTPFGHEGERAIQHILSNIYGELLRVPYLIEEEKDRIKNMHGVSATEAGNADEKRAEIETRIRISDKAYPNVRKNLFAHATNSVRILERENIFEAEGGQLSNDVIRELKEIIYNGIANHSWKPWEDIFFEAKFRKPASTIYLIGQLVAIADQTSSIISDLEDLETVEYSDFTIKHNFFKGNQSLGVPAFRIRAKEYLDNTKNKNRSDSLESDNKILKHADIFEKDPTAIKKGLVTDARFENLISGIAKHIKVENKGTTYFILDDKTYAIFLDILEKDIRKHVQKKISWFTARDKMASTIISILFDHVWSRAPIPGTHTLREQSTRYLDDFKHFFARYYGLFNREEKDTRTDNSWTNDRLGHKSFNQYYSFLAGGGFKIWDTYILENIIKRHAKCIKEHLGREVCLDKEIENKNEDMSPHVARSRQALIKNKNKEIIDILNQVTLEGAQRSLFYESIQIIYLIALVDFIFYQM